MGFVRIGNWLINPDAIARIKVERDSSTHLDHVEVFFLDGASEPFYEAEAEALLESLGTDAGDFGPPSSPEGSDAES